VNVAGNVATEIMLFLRTAGLGVVMGVAYDGLRIFRKGISHRKEWVDREDLVFWICAGLLFFEFLIYYYQGKLRFFEIVAVCFGAWLYQRTASPLIVRVGGRGFAAFTGLCGKCRLQVCKLIKWLKNGCKRVKLQLCRRWAAATKDHRGEQTKNGKSKRQSEKRRRKKA
jgi:spore cortex biosynthesis protein YabQ